jgi:hypothetical protein
MSPAFLASGETATLRIDAPNERESEPMTALTIALPIGLVADPQNQPVTEGWRLEVAGGNATWTGGTTAPGEPASFELRVEASGEPGSVTIEAKQRYPSGATVSWTPAFTILPATDGSPSQRPGRALVAAIVGLIVVGGGLVVAHRLRRRTLQER